MSLEKINDDLIDFLPYEIDDDYILRLFKGIITLKIKEKRHLYFYENIKDKYEIWVDKKGIAILKEMVEYYKEKDYVLATNTDCILKYFDYYSSNIDIYLKMNDISDFFDEFGNKEGLTYVSMFQDKLDYMKKNRFSNPDYLYAVDRKINGFELFLCNYSDQVFEKNPYLWNSCVKFANRLSPISDVVFNTSVVHYKNKLYELK